MHSNSLGCPKILPLSASVLYWLSHLTCISSLKAKNERKTFIFTQLKISRYSQPFSLFLDEFLETDLRPVYFSLTCSLAIRSSCAVYLPLHTRVQCRVNKHSSGCSCVTGMRHATSYQSIIIIFFFLQAYIQERGRETES